MNTALTYDEIIQIINNSESHAKIVYERMYNKVITICGGNEQFKQTIDSIFDKVCAAQIELMKSEINNIFIDFMFCIIKYG